MRSSDGREDGVCLNTTMSRCVRGTRSVGHAVDAAPDAQAVLQLDLDDVVAVQAVERDLSALQRVRSAQARHLYLHAIPEASAELRWFGSAVANAVDCQCSHGGHVLTHLCNFDAKPVAHTMDLDVREEVCFLQWRLRHDCCAPGRPMLRTITLGLIGLVCAGNAYGQQTIWQLLRFCPPTTSGTRPSTRCRCCRIPASMVTTIGASRGFHADFGAGMWDGGPIGIPFVTVSRDADEISRDVLVLGRE